MANYYFFVCRYLHKNVDQTHGRRGEVKTLKDQLTVLQQKLEGYVQKPNKGQIMVNIASNLLTLFFGVYFSILKIKTMTFFFKDIKTMAQGQPNTPWQTCCSMCWSLPPRNPQTRLQPRQYLQTLPYTQNPAQVTAGKARFPVFLFRNRALFCVCPPLNVSFLAVVRQNQRMLARQMVRTARRQPHRELPYTSLLLSADTPWRCHCNQPPTA